MTHPIVLAHGVCRFDLVYQASAALPEAFASLRDRVHYFRGVRTALEAEGFVVRHTSVGWADSVAMRAKELLAGVRAVLDETGADKVNIVAHSMGGLDARHMLFTDSGDGRIHERIASLTTIATPHEGSPVADAIANRLDGLAGLERWLPVRAHALLDLRTAACKRFGTDPDVVLFEDRLAEAIPIRTYAGVYDRPLRSLLPSMAFSISTKAEGPNDGVVSIGSARWRDAFFQGIWEDTDHANETGWQSPLQVLTESSPRFIRRIHGRYLEIARQLP